MSKNILQLPERAHLSLDQISTWPRAVRQKCQYPWKELIRLTLLIFTRRDRRTAGGSPRTMHRTLFTGKTGGQEELAMLFN